MAFTSKLLDETLFITYGSATSAQPKSEDEGLRVVAFEESLKQLTGGEKTISKLELMKLPWNEIGVVEIIEKMLHQQPKLSYVRIHQGNSDIVLPAIDWGDVDILELFSVTCIGRIFQLGRNVRDFKVLFNNIGKQTGSDLARVLEQSHGEGFRLERVQFGPRCKFMEGSVQELATRGLQKHPSLQQLSLSGCNLSEGDIVCFLRNLPPNLQELTLSSTLLKPQSTKELANVLSTSNLRSLVMKYCFTDPVSKSEFRAFCKALGKNKVLQSLDLSYNKLDDQDMAAMVEDALVENCTLEKLKMTQNSFTEKSLNVISCNLHSIELREFSIQGRSNRFSAAGVNQIADSVPVNHTLESFDIFPQLIPVDACMTCKMISYHLNMNWGGFRKLLSKGEPSRDSTFVLGLWALVLERANGIGRLQRPDLLYSNDIIFDLLRNGPLLKQPR